MRRRNKYKNYDRGCRPLTDAEVKVFVERIQEIIDDRTKKKSLDLPVRKFLENIIKRNAPCHIT